MTATTPYIVAENVCKTFGTNQVLKEVSTHFNTGEVTVIIGASGSGKSTLLRAINRLEPHDSGTIRIGGVPVTDDPRTLQQQRCEVGMVFQQFNLFGHMSALDNVALAPRRLRHLSRAQANEQAMTLLRRVGMQDHAHKYPWQLSGGQQQRVAIARALAMAPKVMLFDEPTSALDTTVQKQVLEELLMLRNTLHTAMIIITHNIGVARHLADRVAVLYKGEIVEMGKTKEVLENPQHPYTKSLMAAVPKLAYGMEKEA